MILVDKPLEWTSFDIVNKIRFSIKKSLGVKKFKVGHAGTLDPLASGLLLVCVGPYTKKIEQLMGLDKIYRGTLLLGQSTPSYDLETEADTYFPISHIDEDRVKRVAKSMIGALEQVPPPYSAVKKGGVAAYKLARQGKKVELQARTIRVDSFTLDKIELPEITFTVECSKGTYIRSLVYDFGRMLDSGAVMSSLQRTSIGSYSLEDSLKIEDICSAIHEAF